MNLKQEIINKEKDRLSRQLRKVAGKDNIREAVKSKEGVEEYLSKKVLKKPLTKVLIERVKKKLNREERC